VARWDRNIRRRGETVGDRTLPPGGAPPYCEPDRHQDYGTDCHAESDRWHDHAQQRGAPAGHHDNDYAQIPRRCACRHLLGVQGARGPELAGRI
jgi:hypothetical protein